MTEEKQIHLTREDIRKLITLQPIKLNGVEIRYSGKNRPSILPTKKFIS